MTDSAGKRRLRSTAQDAADVQEEGTAVMSPDLPPEVVEQVAKVLCEQFYGDALSKPAPNAVNPLAGMRAVCRAWRAACDHSVTQLLLVSQPVPALDVIAGRFANLESLRLHTDLLDNVAQQLTLLPAFLKLKTLFLEDTRCQVLPKLQHPSLETLVILADDTLATMCQPQLPALQQLLVRAPLLVAIQVVSCCTALTLLNLVCARLADLRPVHALTGLQRLSITSKWLSEIAPLASLTSLVSLELSGNAQPLSGCVALRSLTSLQSVELSVTRMTNIRPLSMLTALTSVHLLEAKYLSTIQPLASLSSLQAVTLEKCEALRHIAPLSSSAASLTRLSLECQLVSDWGTLESLTALQQLCLTDSATTCTSIPYLTALQALTSLQLACPKLKHANTAGSSTIHPLGRLTALRRLELDLVYHRTDASPLTALKQLTSLKFREKRRLSAPCDEHQGSGNSWHVIPRMSWLQELDTTWPACKALPALTRLRHLRSLLLCQMEELTNIASLAQLTWLSTLRLLGCYKLEDIGPLCALRALTTLQLGVLHVKDIKWLSHLTGLQSLGLPSCYYLTNISPLSRLAGLTQLDLSACEGVKDTRPVADLPVVKGLVGEYKSPRVRAAGFGDS